MKQITFLVLLAFTLVGCTKEEVKDKLCDAGKTAAGIVAAQVSVELDCKNVDAVRADIEKKLLESKICEKKAEPVEGAQLMKAASVVGDAICTPVVDGLLAGLLTQVPAAWECSGGKVAEDVRLKLIASCSKAF